MMRTLRALTGCGLLAAAVVLMFSFVGCGGGGGTCASDADCTKPQTCDLSTFTCKTPGTTPGCKADADCSSDGTQVCDTNAGKNGTCFQKCSGDTDCSEGETCDATLKRCTCDATKCDPRDGGGKFGCHPVISRCLSFCTDNSQCESGEKCHGADGKKHCIKEGDIPADECQADADCKDATKPKCDTAASPKKCIAPADCTDDACCANKDATKPKYDKSTMTCVQCTGDGDCTGTNEKCDLTGTCKAPDNCADSESCYNADTDKMSYCPEKGNSQCTKAALDCTADKKANGNDGWTAGIKQGNGSIIWNPQVKRVTDATSCSDFPDGAAKCTDGNDCGQGEICSTIIKKCVASCDTNDDCDSGSVCNKDLGDIPAKKGACVVGISNGTVEIKFNFFHPNSKFKSGKEGTKGDIVKFHDDRGIATQVTIESGDAKEGVAQFGFCSKEAAGKYSFFVKDEGGAPSNSACYDLPAR